MSIPFSGTLTRSGGVTAAINNQLKTLTLKPVKKIAIKFDPFHNKVVETRYFMHYISAPKIIKTNLSCSIKTEVLCDRTDPSVTFSLDFETFNYMEYCHVAYQIKVNGEEVIFKSANLTALEMVKLYNKHITVLVPKETISDSTATTKALKKAVVGKKR